jgi:cytidylate kinase
MSHYSIAIDGPSGAGKSTLAKLLAKELNFLYVDTGAIYRTVGLAALRQGVSPEDESAVAALLPGLDIRMGYGEDGLQRMVLNGEDVTEAIRQNEVSQWASQVASLPAVRAFLLEMQRKTARENDVIMDGRDIGTVVLPQADLKLYLTADASARADRRYAELVERGQTVEREQILRDVIERDERDMSRAVSPLKQAEDAVVVDTTKMDLEESFHAMLDIIREKLTL